MFGLAEPIVSQEEPEAPAAPEEAPGEDGQDDGQEGGEEAAPEPDGAGA